MLTIEGSSKFRPSEFNDLVFLPSGELVASLRFAMFDPIEEEYTSISERSMLYRTELVYWTVPDFNERMLITCEQPAGRYEEQVRLLKASGDFIFFEGQANRGFHLESLIVRRRFSMGDFGRVTMSPDGTRYLRTKHPRFEDYLEINEDYLYLSETEDRLRFRHRIILLYRTRLSSFFFGPDNRTIFQNPNESGVLYRLRVLPESTMNTEHGVEEILVPESSYAIPTGHVSESWQSFDGSLVILKQEQLFLMNLNNPLENRLLDKLEDPSSIRCLSIHPSNQFLILNRANSNICQVIELATQSIIREFEWGSSPVRNAAFNRDGTLIAVISGYNRIIVWDVDF